MALNFPSSPSLNDTYTYNGKTYVWNGTVWNVIDYGLPSGGANTHMLVKSSASDYDVSWVNRGEEIVGSISTNTLDLSSGTVFSSTPSSDPTYVFSNPPASGIAYGFTLKITPSATITITWPASVDWPGGTAPEAPASGETDVFVFYTQDGGTTYYGFSAGGALA